MSANNIITSATGLIANQYVPPSGLFVSNSWTTNTPGSGYSSATITNVSLYLTSASVISAAVQDGLYADTNGSWLMSAVPSTANGGTITFNVYAQPSSQATFKIAWAVAKF
jgi:hypothetical protein